MLGLGLGFRVYFAGPLEQIASSCPMGKFLEAGCKLLLLLPMAGGEEEFTTYSGVYYVLKVWTVPLSVISITAGQIIDN